MTFGFQNERDATDAARLIRRERQYGGVTHTEPIRQSSSSTIQFVNGRTIIVPPQSTVRGVFFFTGLVDSQLMNSTGYVATVVVTAKHPTTNLLTSIGNNVFNYAFSPGVYVYRFPMTTQVLFSHNNTHQSDQEISYRVEENIQLGRVGPSSGFTLFGETWIYTIT